VPAAAMANCGYPPVVPALVLNTSKTVPANIGGIPFFGTSGEFDIERIEGDTSTPVETTVVDSLTPEIKVAKPADWAEGNTYHVVLMDGETTVIDDVITVIAAFTLTGSPTLEASYTDDADFNIAILRAELTMSGLAALSDADLSPYLNFETIIDGKTRTEGSVCTIGPRPGVTAFGPGVDQMVAPCVSSLDGTMTSIEDYMSAGTYSVGMEVSIIGDTAAQITPAITVDLCAPSNENNEGGTTNGATTNNSDETGSTEGDAGCSSTSGNMGMLALLGLVGFFRRRK